MGADDAAGVPASDRDRDAALDTVDRLLADDSGVLEWRNVGHTDSATARGLRDAAAEASRGDVVVVDAHARAWRVPVARLSGVPPVGGVWACVDGSWAAVRVDEATVVSAGLAVDVWRRFAAR